MRQRLVKSWKVTDNVTGIEFDLRKFKVFTWPHEWSAKCRALRRKLKHNVKGAHK